MYSAGFSSWEERLHLRAEFAGSCELKNVRVMQGHPERRYFSSSSRNQEPQQHNNNHCRQGTMITTTIVVVAVVLEPSYLSRLEIFNMVLLEVCVFVYILFLNHTLCSGQLAKKRTPAHKHTVSRSPIQSYITWEEVRQGGTIFRLDDVNPSIR